MIGSAIINTNNVMEVDKAKEAPVKQMTVLVSKVIL